MTLQEYIESLQALVEERPELADAEVWYAADDEGNMYGEISYAPSIYFAPNDAKWQDENLVSEENFQEDLLENNGIYREDFSSEAEYQSAIDEAALGFKTVVVVN